MKTFASENLRRLRRPATPITTACWRGQSHVIAQSLAAPTVQAKLTIGAPDDAYEREANHVAEAVMRMPDLGHQPIASSPPEVRRQEEDEEEMLQAKSGPGGIPALTKVGETAIARLRGGGQPLPESERSFFEPRFGADFSKVRVHHDAKAAKVARSIRARAFTVGHDVAFAPGEYAPSAPSGRRLLAHELTHVVQQNGTGGSAPVFEPGASEVRTKPARGADPGQGEEGESIEQSQFLNVPGDDRDRLVQREGAEDAPPETTPASPDVAEGAVPAQAAPAPAGPAAPSLGFGATGTTLNRGDTLNAAVAFTPNAGETLNVTSWEYITPGHGTITRAATDATFQSAWSGTMAVSGRLEMKYTITPAGGTAGAEQTLSQEITVNNRTGANWESSVTEAAETAFNGQPSPPRVFSDLGHHSAGTNQANPTTSAITTGPNQGMTFVSTMATGTYTSTPQIHPDLTAATSAFKTFHSDPSILFFVVGATKTRIPNSDYSGFSLSGSLTFTVPAWETFYKAHNVFTVRATATTGGKTVTVRDAWWGLASNARNASFTITNEPALRAALGDASGPYTGGYSFSATPRGSWSGHILMQAAAILSGTQSHEYVHATHSHRANFKAMVGALDPRKVLERTVSAPGHTVNFNDKTTSLIREILRPDHEIVDPAASATAEAFVAQPGVTMAGVNTNPATGAFLGSVWNIHGDAEMTN